MAQIPKDYRDALKDDDKSLEIFINDMSTFDRYFCELMFTKKDFTLRMEVHGCNGKLLHSRVQNDGFQRPPQAPQKRT